MYSNNSTPLLAQNIAKNSALDTLTLIQPDDFHVHFRDGDLLKQTVNATASQFARCLVMPNLNPPVQTVLEAKQYLNRITQALKAEYNYFKPYLTLYLTPATSIDTIKQVGELRQNLNSDIADILGFKWYPMGATTHSNYGIVDIFKHTQLLDAMQTYGVPLMVHGEVVREEVDIFDREAYFIDEVLTKIRKQFPQLKISFEHITTKQAVDFVQAQASPYLGASITPQHLLFNRNHLLVGGVRPHYYCLPILKRNIHQQALLKAATSGLPYFYAGSDTAPHSQANKETACGCAGCYTGFHTMPLYIKAFEQQQALANLEVFTSINAANFYGLPINQQTVTYVKKPWQVPAKLGFFSQYQMGDECLDEANSTQTDSRIIPLMAGELLDWQLLK